VGKVKKPKIRRIKLIVITHDTFFSDESAILNFLLIRGLKILHIRKPKSSIDEVRSLIGKIHESLRPQIVLHDHYELANEFNIGGIHLNDRNGYNHKVREGLTISRSCHSLKEVLISKEYDYLFLSPIFDSISKPGYRSAFPIDRLMRAKNRKVINERIIALGGITQENVYTIRECGFGGIAVLGAIWNQFFIDKSYTELRRRYEALKSSCIWL
jgi:thiamine-phosphate pyrophosphorylase